MLCKVHRTNTVYFDAGLEPRTLPIYGMDWKHFGISYTDKLVLQEKSICFITQAIRNALFKEKIFALDTYRSIDINTSQLNIAWRGIQNALQIIKQIKYLEICLHDANSWRKARNNFDY
jgi:hypothetical protein